MGREPSEGLTGAHPDARVGTLTAPLADRRRSALALLRKGDRAGAVAELRRARAALDAALEALGGGPTEYLGGRDPAPE